MLNLQKCKIDHSENIPIITGATVAQEGIPLTGLLEDGIEKVKPLVGDTADKFVGVSYGETSVPTIKSFVYDAVIPAASPYTIQLPKNNLVATQIAIREGTGYATAFTEDTIATTKFSCVDATGVVTFHVDDAGKSVRITFRYNPTAQELLMEDSFSFSPSGFATIGSCGVITKGVVFTDQFDASKNWLAATGVESAAGLFTDQTGSGNVELTNVKIVSIPTVDDPFLGLRY